MPTAKTKEEVFNLFILNKNGEQKRFWSKVKIHDNNKDCWIWIGYCDYKGYGSIRLNNKNVLAHRLSISIYQKAPVDNDKVVLHLCDNPSCVNPIHLLIGNHQDNMDDMKSKKRHTFGETKYNSILTVEKVVKARKMALKGFTTAEISRFFNVKHETIRQAINGLSWKSVNSICEPVGGHLQITSQQWRQK